MTPRYAQFFSILFMIIPLISCSTHSNITQDINHHELLTGEPLFSEYELSSIPEPNAQLFYLNDQMREHIATHITQKRSKKSKVSAIVNSLIGKDRKAMKYEPSKTYTASEMFEHKEGNCLAFSILFASFAREQNINISFQKVHVPPSWNTATEQLFFYNQHVNIRVNLPHATDLVIDIDQINNQPHYPVSKITDEQVEALYYNNIGSQHLQSGDHLRAFIYLRKAIKLAPNDSSLWSNLGVLYRQKGLNTYAEKAYFTALKHDRNMNSALNNLSVLYYHIGEEDKADYYQFMVRSHRMKNPYYRYYRAVDMFNKQDYYASLKHIKYAIKKNNAEPKFHQLLAQINSHLELSAVSNNKTTH